MKRAWAATAFVSLLLFVLTLSLSMAGQAIYGDITGTVTDPTGAVVAGATVKVTNINTGVTRTFTTNAAGIYNAASLPPGVYKVEAEAAGFKTAVVTEITLEVGAKPRVDLALQVGQKTEVVSVTAEVPLLSTQQSNLGQTVTEKQLEQLPTIGTSGRSIFGLITLTAGTSQQAGCDGCETNGNVRINGDRPRNQDYVLDGTSITQPVFGGQSFEPSTDTIQEFRIETNSMSAEYGKAGGGILIAVSKSGTNKFHGTVYEYNRNQKLNARNYFENPALRKNPFTYNEFGGSLGGPIIKNKLFFFAEYQGVRSHGGVPANYTVPNGTFRGGDLGALCTAGFNAAGVCANAAQQIHYPGTTTAVAYNRIPTAQISGISQKLLAIWPTSPTAASAPGTSALLENAPNSTTVNRINPRIDFDLSQSDRIFGVFHRETGPKLAYNLIVGPAGEQITQTNDYATTIGWTHTFSTTMLNDFRFGYMHRIGDRANYGQGNTSPSDFGITGIPNCLSSVPRSEGGTKCGTPGVTISGFTALDATKMLYEPASTLQLSNVITKLVGRHSMKFGTEMRHYVIDNYQPNGVSGKFVFTGSESGNAFADFLFGVINNGSVQVQNTMVSSRAWAYSFFLQDDYRLTPKLTLNLGLRYQIDRPFEEIHRGDAFFNPFTASWEQFGVNAPRTAFDGSYREFGPRLGFAWNPISTFVVRGGYGIMYPGAVGHGRAGDSEPGPNLLANTPLPRSANWANLPTITNPSPDAITAPIPVNRNVYFSAWAPRKQTPTYIQLWNLTLEKELPSNTLVQLAYVGSHGTHLPVNYGYNICQQTPQSTIQFGYNATTSPYCPAAAQAVQAGGGSLYDLVIVPGYWGLSSSVYHSMQAKVERRFTGGFSLLSNLTWSKLIDDSSSDWGGFWSLDALGQDFYNRKAERSVSAGDIPLRLTIAPIFELPFGHGKKYLNQGIASQVLGGWRMSAVYTVNKGTPFGLTDNSYGFCNAAHLNSDRPMMIGNPLPSGFQQTPAHWFDITAFDFSGNCPAANLVDLTGPGDVNKAFGDAPRFYSNIRNPGVNNFDFSVQKDFKLPIGEQGGLRFRADIFNLPNHPQFAEAQGDPLNSNFGQITRTSLGNRVTQLSLRIYF